MNNTLVIVHLYCMGLGVGGGFANMIAGRLAAGAEPAVARTLGQLQSVVGRVGFLAIMLLWITGVWMVNTMQNGFANLPTTFWIKIAAVVILTLAALTMQAKGIAAKRSGVPPAAEIMKRLGMVSGAAAITAVIFAVISFH